MGRSKGNLKRGVPARIGNPPNKAIYPEWWEDGENLMRLHPSYIERRNYEQKKQQKSR
jgi:antibiotic biosynthesis monooxygenase (ABM) superfamily enzyme